MGTNKIEKQNATKKEIQLMKSREKRLGNNAAMRKDDRLPVACRMCCKAIGNQRPVGDIRRLQEDLCKKEHSGNQI